MAIDPQRKSMSASLSFNEFRGRTLQDASASNFFYYVYVEQKIVMTPMWDTAVTSTVLDFSLYTTWSFVGYHKKDLPYSSLNAWPSSKDIGSGYGLRHRMLRCIRCS